MNNGEKTTSTSEYVQLAQKAYEQKDYNQVIENSQKAINLDDKNADAYYWWGRACYELVQDEEALAKYQKAIELNSQYKADAYYWRGRIFYNQQNDKAAIANFERCTQTKEDYADAYYLWGASLFGLAQYDEASAKYQKAIDLNSQYKADAYYWHGQIFYALKKDKEAQIDFEKCIEIKPDYAQAYYYLGNIFYSAKNYEEATKQFQKCIEIKPDYAEAYYYLGNILYSTQNYQEAADNFQASIDIKPEYSDPYYWLASSFAWLGKYEEAASKFEEFIQVNPDEIAPEYIDVYYWLGRTYIRLGKDESAIENLEIFREKYRKIEEELKDIQMPQYLEDEYIFSFYCLGIGLYNEKKFSESENAFKQYVDNKKKLDLFIAYLDLGQAYVNFKKYNLAVENFKKALNELNQYEPSLKIYETGNIDDQKIIDLYYQNKLDALSSQGFALEQQNQYDSAIKIYKQIITFIERKQSKKEEKNEFLLDYLINANIRISSIFILQKQYDQAIDYLKKAEKIDHNLGYVYYTWSEISYQIGNYQDSWKQINEAVTQYEKDLQKNLIDKNNKERTIRQYKNLGSIYQLYFNELTKAKEMYLQGFKLDPNNISILISLTNLYLTLTQDDGVELEVNKCTYYSQARIYRTKTINLLEIEKNRYNHYSTLIELGNFLLRTKEIAEVEEDEKIEKYFLEALQQLEEMRKSDGIDFKQYAIQAYTVLGIFYSEQYNKQPEVNQLNKALDYFKKAHNLDLDNLTLMSYLAEVCLIKGMLDEADQGFNKVLKINSSHVDSLIGLGKVYLEMGDKGKTEMYSKAIEEFGKAKKILQSYKGSRKAKKVDKNSFPELADLSYTQGYANFQIYQKSSILEGKSAFLDAAITNFRTAIQENSHHYNANRAKETIENSFKKSGAEATLGEKIGSGLLVFLFSLIFTAAQVLCFWELPISYSLDEETLLKNQAQITLQKAPIIKFGSPGHITLTFGSLLLAIIGLYLSRITKLSVGKEGIQLEKSLQETSLSIVGIGKLDISRPTSLAKSSDLRREPGR